jgi:hypothetical protein
MRSPNPAKPHSGVTDDGLGDPLSIVNDPNAWLAPVDASFPVGTGTGMASVGDLGTVSGESAGNPSGSATVSGTAAAPAPTTVTTTGSSLVINLNWDTSVSSAPSGFMSDIVAVAHFLESQITNAVTINFNVGYDEVGGTSLVSGALGESQTTLTSVSYSALVGALTNTRSTDPTDTAVLASLPANSPVSGTYWLTDAQAKALGLQSANGTSIDGDIGFGLSSQFSYGATNTSGTVTSGTYDFFATAAHEMTEVMGRLLLVGQTIVSGAGYALLDLLHYSASGTRDFTQSTAGYLSVDGGATNLGAFNTNTPGDAGDWASSVGNNSFNAFATAGVLEPVTTNDVTEMDAIGWNLAGSQTAVVPPTISGTVAGQAVTDQATLSPFLHVTIADPNAGQTETLTVALSTRVNGTLSNLGGGSYNASTGVYTVTGSAAAVTTALDGLVFTPTAHEVPPGWTVTTQFTITDTDTIGASATDNTTTVITTDIAVPPTISGTVAGQAVTDQATISPFLHATIADLNVGQTETLTVTLSATANGTLSNLGGGSYNPSTGAYTVTGSATAVTTALDGLVFTPTGHQVPPGQSVTTGFTIKDTDSAGSSATDNTTTVIATAIARSLAISGTVAGQAVTDQAAISPFLHVAIMEPNAGQTETVTVTLSATANGTLSTLGGGSYNPSTGVYTVTGLATAVTTALDGLVFTPTGHQVPPGQTVTTGFTIQDTDTAGFSVTDSTTTVIATAIAVTPTIGGTVAGQAVTDQATISPFLHVTIADLNAGQTETVTVTLSAPANGTLSSLGGGSYNPSTGVYTVTGLATAVTTTLDGLVFTPTGHQVSPGQSVTTGFTIKDTDTAGISVTDSTTTVIATAIAVTPTISGAVAGQTLTDQATISPFSHVTIVDLNAGQTDTVTVTLSATADGTLTNLGSGNYNASTGVYTVIGSATAVTTALDGWVFDPTLLVAPAGQTVSTSFTISITDTARLSASDSTTSAITTETNNTGLIGILSADQQLEMIYIAYFGRAADGPGLTFWAGQDVQAQAAGQSSAVALTNIANSFTPQSETLALYPFLGTPNLDLSSPNAQAGLSTFIDNVYSNLFGHAADANGKAFWVGQLTSGSVGLGAAALAIANGATGADSIEVRNKINVALDFTTRTSSAGLGNTAPLPSSFVTAAHTVLGGVDGMWLDDASTTSGISATTAYISTSTTGHATTGSLATDTITITGSDQLIDPGASSHTIQFIAGASADAIVLHTTGADQIGGFDPSTDVLDFRSLLNETNIDLDGDITALGKYLTITDQGSDAVLGFDSTGHGSGTTVAVLQGLGSTVTGLDTLIAHGAIRIA